MDISGIDYLGFERVLKRGSGEIIEERDDALFIRDSVSGAYFLACDDQALGIALLDRHAGRGYELLTVSNHALGEAAFERYGFSEKLECHLFAYYGERPPLDPSLSVRTAEERDLPMLMENYHRISPEELERVVGRKSMLLGYHRGRLVGFIGEHLEGSMGMLYVFPEYRRRGFGAGLLRHLIARTMENGDIPFDQVERDNPASLSLHRRIGMTQSERVSVWMWR